MFISIQLSLRTLAGRQIYMNESYAILGDDAQNERVSELLDRLHGGNGPWDGINTLVFLFTSFTTVGFGNHPSLVRTVPPCQYPSQSTQVDDPYSVLLPEALRPAEDELLKNIAGSFGGGAGNAASAEVGAPAFFAPPRCCFEGNCEDDGGSDEDCWIVSDDQSIFDFGKLLYFQTYESKKAANYTTRADELLELELPGLRTTLSQMKIELPPVGNSSTTRLGMAWRQLAFAKIRDECDAQLNIWRKEENKKDNAKLYTILFVIVGIGLLGIVVGALGNEVMAAIKSVFNNVEMALDAATLNQVGAKTGDKKGIFVSMVVMFLILGLGTYVYAQLEQMRPLDALYFTVVTATTVGFGDYVPTVYSAKVCQNAGIHISLCAQHGKTEPELDCRPRKLL